MDWNRILGLSSVDRDKLRHTGYGYLKRGDYETALIYFEGLAKLEEGNLFDMRALGCIYLQMGEASRALDLFDHILQIDPSDRTTQLNRAKALCMKGEVEMGVQEARLLSASSDEMIASLAGALVMAHGEEW